MPEGVTTDVGRAVVVMTDISFMLLMFIVMFMLMIGTGTNVSNELGLKDAVGLPSGQVMIGQHWSGRFSIVQSCPIGLVNGQTFKKHMSIASWQVQFRHGSLVMIRSPSS